MGRVPFLKPVNLTPIDIALSLAQADIGTAYLASLGPENLKKTVKFSIWSLEVSVVIEPRN